MTDPDTPTPPIDPKRLPRHTTPTWEVEMLISGAAVFAMLQLPGWLGNHILSLLPRFAGGARVILTLIYAYLTSAAVILAITFALHLLLRAQWIALVGMRSVFPDGVRWEKIRTGRILRDLLRQHDSGAAIAIERADNRATVIFACGVMMAMTLLWLGLAACLAFVAAIIFNHGTHLHVDPLYLLTGLATLIFLPLLLGMGLDFWLGHRLRPNTWLRRLLAGLFAIYRRLGMLPSHSVSRILESRIGTHRFQWVSIGVVLPVTAGVFMSMYAWHGYMHIGSYDWFPHFAEPNSAVIAAAHYDDQRHAEHDPVVPYIQSEVVTGPYLRLTVPYFPKQDAPPLRKTCRTATAARTADMHANALLDCLTALHAVSLDGKSLTSLHYDIASDPRTERPALQAMIDVRTLAPGRHELRVARPPLPPDLFGKRDKSKAWIIPFWH